MGAPQTDFIYALHKAITEQSCAAVHLGHIEQGFGILALHLLPVL